MKGTKMLLGCALLAASLVASNAQAQTTLRMTWYSDGNEGEVMTDLLRRFEEQNKDIKVVLDQVPFKAINENLPVQLAAGQGPDLARVADLGGVARYMLDLRPLLKDPAYFETNFGPFLEWMRLPGDTTSIPGYMTQLTLTGPLVNKTLFEQANIPMPGAKATWEEWAKAAKDVATKVQAPFPVAIDRSGHRFFSLAITQGAKVFNDKGEPAVVDDGFKKGAQLVYDWHKNGVMSKELWGSVAGTAYRGANDEFKNAQVVMYVSGSWQIGQFDKTIGNAFDWVAVPTPCGPPTARPCRAARRWSPSRRPSIRKRSHVSSNISPARKSSASSTIARSSSRVISVSPSRALATRMPRRRARRRSRCSAKVFQRSLRSPTSCRATCITV